MVLRSVEFSNTEGIFEAAGEHSGRQFESCIKFRTSTTTLPFEIVINSSHQPTNSSTSDFHSSFTFHQPTIQPYTTYQPILQRSSISNNNSTGINTPNAFSSLFFVLHQLQSKNAQLLRLIRSYVYTIFRVGKTYFRYIYIFFYLFLCFFLPEQ